jgi:hypothetical protein
MHPINKTVFIASDYWEEFHIFDFSQFYSENYSLTDLYTYEDKSQS